MNTSAPGELAFLGAFCYNRFEQEGGSSGMTTKREQAMRNAVASARMEGLPVSKQTERDCVRYLEGRIDTATLVQEILNRQRGQDRPARR